MRKHVCGVGLVAAACLLATPTAWGDVFVVGVTGPMGVDSSLFRFSDDGQWLGTSVGVDRNLYTSLATDGTSLYVPDMQGSLAGVVEKFDAQGNYLGVFARPDDDLMGEGPVRIGVGTSGDVYVHNFPQGAPQDVGRYDPSGQLVQTYADPSLSHLEGVETDAAGNVYALKHVGQRKEVFRFASSGELLDVLDLSAMKNPNDLAIDRKTQVLFVGDEFGGENAVACYSIAPETCGQYLGSITVPGYTNVFGIGYDPVTDHLLLSSLWTGRCVEVDRSGNILHSFSHGLLGRPFDIVALRSLPLEVDIRPGANPNPICPGAGGLVTVAILGGDTVDVRDVNEATLMLAGAAPEPRGKSGHLAAYEDVNGDAITDLLVRFRIAALGLAAEATTAELTGRLLDGTPIAGSDSVRVLRGGDANMDGVVDGLDYNLWSAHYRMSDLTWSEGDFNGDATADGLDYNIWSRCYAPADGAAIPEPAALSLLVAGGLMLIRRRR